VSGFGVLGTRGRRQGAMNQTVVSGFGVLGPCGRRQG
jgi:hypothetical protein